MAILPPAALHMCAIARINGLIGRAPSTITDMLEDIASTADWALYDDQEERDRHEAWLLALMGAFDGHDRIPYGLAQLSDRYLLRWASERGDLALVRRVWASGPAPHKFTADDRADNQTALAKARLCGHGDVEAFLLAAGNSPA